MIYNYSMKYFYQNFKNLIDFYLRQNIKLSRKDYYEKNEPKEGSLTSQEGIEKEKYLIEKYGLEPLKNSTTKINYLENLYTIDLLDQYLNVKYKENKSVLDIGSKNWFYAKGEYFFFKKYCENLNLDGIELDANRLYSNFYSREEVAKFHIKNLSGANYIAGDFLKYNKKYDYIIWILPFIKKYPHLKWGLPLEYFKPNEMLKHAYDSLNEGGQMLIINQGKEEFEIQKQLLKIASINYQAVGKIESIFSNYKIDRYLVMFEK